MGDVLVARMGPVTGRPRSRTLVMLAVVQAIAFAGVALVALDLYTHKPVETVAGLNMWGYRGAVAHQRQPGEIRLVVLGGSRAFGLGMPESWTIATVVRQELMLAIDKPGHEIRHVIALTLAQPSALPDSYSATLERYAYLRPDYICFYDDLGVGGGPQPNEISGVFAHTGYWPALPLAVREKGMLWRFGSVRAGYVHDGSSPTASGLVGRATGAALEGAGTMLSRADRFFARRPLVSHRGNSQRYAADFVRAVDRSLDLARGVVVAVSPPESPMQVSNSDVLTPALERTVAKTRRLRLVNMTDEPLLLDPSQRLDGWNYGGDAIAAVARRIAPALLDLIANDDATARSR